MIKWGSIFLLGCIIGCKSQQQKSKASDDAAIVAKVMQVYNKHDSKPIVLRASNTNSGIVSFVNSMRGINTNFQEADSLFQYKDTVWLKKLFTEKQIDAMVKQKHTGEWNEALLQQYSKENPNTTQYIRKPGVFISKPIYAEKHQYAIVYVTKSPCTLYKLIFEKRHGEWQSIKYLVH